jgi:uncharacterized Ntn-hydrolase superfamily protein
MWRVRLVVLVLALLPALGLALAPREEPRGRPTPQPSGDYAATFSIVAYDPGAKEWGVAVASRYLAVGAVVPFAKAGCGAVASQASVNVTLGTKGLELLGSGKSAGETLKALGESDKNFAWRQVGVVDAKGRAATHTGKKCTAWAGGKAGKHYAVQGNILTGKEVIDEMAKAYEERGKWPLAWRLMSALEAGEGAGGDKRGKQAAALLVVRAGWGPKDFGGRYVDLRVDDHEEPVRELARILAKRLRKPGG